MQQPKRSVDLSHLTPEQREALVQGSQKFVGPPEGAPQQTPYFQDLMKGLRDWEDRTFGKAN